MKGTHAELLVFWCVLTARAVNMFYGIEFAAIYSWDLECLVAVWE